MYQNILLFFILWPMLGGVFCFTMGRKNHRIRNKIANIVTGIEFLSYLLLLYQCVSQNRILELVLPNVCGLGLSFKMDGFRMFYAGIAIYMWFMSTIFSEQYFVHHQNRNRYYFFILFTLGATVGVFLSNDFFTTYLFFELMSFASYVWVAQEETKEALKAAETYLAVAVIGGMVLLMGIFLLYYEGKTLDFEAVHNLFLNGANTKIYVAGGCMLVGFGAKAGMFPLHIWLPKAHPVAPAPASALLSGILTKTGIFGVLLLVLDLFFYDLAFATAILILGTITMVGGAVLAVFSTNLKRILACSSMSQIGFILIGTAMIGILGEENTLAIQGTVLHMTNHSLFKLVLFLIAGAIYQNTHELELNKIEGYGYNKPFLKVCFAIAALGISGVPLGSGYVSKTLLHESIVEGIHLMNGELGSLLAVIEWIFIFTGGLTAAYMLKIWFAVFVEKGKKEWNTEGYLNLAGRIAIGVTAGIIFIMGILPNVVMNPIPEFVKQFFYTKQLHHVNYFSLVNLKGGLLSIVIGLLVYFVFIRKILMKKEENGYQYRNCWPSWFDMENSLYRPIFQQLMPFLGAFVCRTLSSIPDNLILGIRNTVSRPAKIRQIAPVGSKFTDFIGSLADDVVRALNKTLFRKNPIRISFVELLAIGRKEAFWTTRLIGRSVSFSLLMACFGLIIMLVYLL